MLTALVALATLTGSTPLRLEPVGDQWVVRATDAGESAITVTLDSPDTNLPPVLGSQTTQGRDRVFTPRFPFQAGVRYRAVVADGKPFTFEIPARALASAAPHVTQVYPSAARLPENQLKFYIEFATPMSRGEAYRRIRLLDPNDAAIELPFLELQEELWDERQQRFTLYFDPGRVKSDLVPNREVGSPLRAGQRYTLVVASGWKDANGRRTTNDYRKTFTVGERDATSPDPKRWKVHAPRSGSKDPLTIEFGEALERALAERMIEIRNPANERVSGRIAVSDEEARWQLTPEREWASGNYALVVDAALEDLAGNKVSRLFEVAIRTDAQRKAAPTSVSVAIEIR